MRILVLGGTAWVSGLLVEEALARGHDVTALARGSVSAVPAGARWVRADRDRPDAYAALDGDWDAVLDVSRQPGHVRGALAALAERAAHWGFVSTVSVYADPNQPGDEDDARLPPLAQDAMASPADYGSAKVACEDLVLAALGDRAHLARAGLIGGPGDHTERTLYWPRRFAQPSTPDGRVLVPAASHAVQVVDARDLATWMLDAAERRLAATLDLCGEPIPLAEHLEVARAVGHAAASGTSGDAAPATTPAPADPAWLEAHHVAPWAGPRSLPLWLPAEAAGLSSRSPARADAAGFRRRPLAETLADGLAWCLARADTEFAAGLSDEDERELLAALAAERGA